MWTGNWKMEQKTSLAPHNISGLSNPILEINCSQLCWSERFKTWCCIFHEADLSMCAVTGLDHWCTRWLINKECHACVQSHTVVKECTPVHQDIGSPKNLPWFSDIMRWGSFLLTNAAVICEFQPDFCVERHFCILLFFLILCLWMCVYELKVECVFGSHSVGVKILYELE